MRKQDYYEPIIGRESEPRRRPKKKKKRANRGERVVVTLLSLLFLTVAIVATVKYVVRAPEPVTDNEDQQTQQDGTAEDSDAIQTISNGKERKKYCYTILAYGVDNDAGGSDTNMLVRFDAENKKIDVVSLPRDTLMSNGRKLNSSYNNGGTEKLRSNIEDMLGIPVDFYVSVDLKGFIALIDQIGGVDFDVPEDMDYDDPYQDLHIHFKAGLQHDQVTLFAGKPEERQRSDGLKLHRLLAALPLDGVNRVEHLLRQVCQRAGRDHLAIDLKPLTEVHHIRADGQTGLVARCRQDGGRHGRKAALAVRARNVDALQLLFGVSQMVAQVLHPGQTGCALPHARQGVQGFNCLLGRHSSSSS